MRVALSGANGRIGRALRPALLEAGHSLVSSDREPSATALLPGESFVAGDLIERATVDALLNGADALVHMGATSNEQAFEQIIDNNHRALREVYEGARRHGVRRIVYASSNHAFGLHPVDRKLRLDAPYRADCFYGLSKIWGEALALMYWEKHGIQSVCLRIGTYSGGPPRNARELATWIGTEDLRQLVLRSLDASDIGWTPVWGISANPRAYVDLSEGNAIGYLPRQSAEEYAQSVLSQPANADPVAERYQGGRFVTQDYTPEAGRVKSTRP